MPTQKELLDSALKIDKRLNNAKSMVKNHKQSKTAAVKRGSTAKAKIEARKDGQLI